MQLPSLHMSAARILQLAHILIHFLASLLNE